MKRTIATLLTVALIGSLVLAGSAAALDEADQEVKQEDDITQDADWNSWDVDQSADQYLGAGQEADEDDVYQDIYQKGTVEQHGDSFDDVNQNSDQDAEAYQSAEDAYDVDQDSDQILKTTQTADSWDDTHQTATQSTSTTQKADDSKYVDQNTEQTNIVYQSAE
ncbi:hypothetical protein [Natrinema salsiterrestre]|uniref:Uncharacterized protein n=1 Tax=Natrinema salsiterrestre TaxID=2950540 RepID=A0A9Q4Q1Z8_9EURY|nr:hypothetical protein [Natrinema salsiterrestre]MDF9744798.1 hypothetical protein [Natrinema salsiterrestre]